MADIFVSYASQDRQRVRPLIERLAAEGWSIWWDRALVAGPNFDRDIEAALADARCVVVAWSRHSVESDWCRAEAAEGLERGILVPIRLDEVRPPLAFRNAHTAALTGAPPADEELDAFLNGVRRCLDDAPPTRQAPDRTTQPPRRASVVRTLVAGLVLAGLAALAWIAFRAAPPEPGDAERAPAAAPIRIAVMEFRDLSPDGELAWLAGGLAVNLRQQLALYDARDLSVVPGPLSRGTVGELPTDTTTVIDGSVAPAADGQVSVLVGMTDVRSRQQLWSRKYVGAMDPPTDLPLDIASQVAKYAGLTSGMDGWGPRAPSARVPFLKYLHFRRGREADQELFWLEQTLAQDPDWVDGWIDLAVTRSWEASALGSPAALAAARDHLRRARSLIGDPEALPWLEGAILQRARAPLGDVEVRYRRTAEEGGYAPGAVVSYAQLMMHAGLEREARQFFEYYAEVEPFGSSVQNLVFARSLTGDLEGAAEATRTQARFFGQSLQGRFPLASLLPQLQRMDDARALRADVARERRRAAVGGRQHGVAALMERVLGFNIAWYSDDAATLASWLEEALQKEDWRWAYLYAAATDDARSEAIAAEVLDALPVRPEWGITRALVPPPLREHPALLAVGYGLGFTPEWRLELCRRAARLPPEAHLTCDPSDYDAPVRVGSSP